MKPNITIVKAVILAVNILSSISSFGQQIAGGARHSLYICSDSTVKSFGRNAGQLGTGNYSNSNVPVSVINQASVAAVSAGYDHSLFLKSDGTVWACGLNAQGQLGNGTNTGTNTPTQITSLSGVIAIQCGYQYSLALKNDGTVWSFGLNNYGQLGNSSTSNSNVPVQVTGLTNVTSIATVGVGNGSFALKSDSTVWAWGSNFLGQLGDGTTTDRTTAVQVNSLSGVIAIDGALALKSNGTVWAWGNNGNGELGVGSSDINPHPTPVQVNGLTNVVAIARGTSRGIALKSDSTVWMWGSNEYGAFGNGTILDSNIPVQSTITGVVSIAGGGPHTLAVKGDETLWTFGRNDDGQLGIGSSTSQNSPQLVTNLCSITGINETTVSSTAKVFPNPFSNQLTFTSSDNEIMELTLYDIFSRQIIQQTITNSTTINTEQLTDGIYFYELRDDKEIIKCGKVLKQ